MSTTTAPARTGDLREVFGIAFPLIMSSGTFAFKLFCDRMMLAWYAERSIAAALSAGMTSFMLAAFFMGVANYGNAFVAQYSGAERHDRTGLAVWQSLLFSLAAGLILIVAGSLLAPMFTHIGHAADLAREEEAYFRVLATGSVFALLNSGIMCFWTGRNKTWTVVAVGFSSIFLNVAVNWALIFGAGGSPNLDGGGWFLAAIGGALNRFALWLGAPSMGVVGAGLATIGTDALGVLVFFILFLTRRNRVEFGTWPKRVFNPALLWRMLRFGFGNGMQLLLDIGSFAVFNILMGLYGYVAGGNVAAASGIAISVNGAAFIPMLGLGAAASIMVGHGIGSRDVAYAVRAVRNARLLIMAYMAGMCILFEVYPQVLVSLFAPGESMTPETRAMAVNFVRFAGGFAISDGFFILYGNAIRGAGDTRFSMLVMGLCGWFLFALPCVAAYLLGAGPYVLWAILLFYAIAAATIFYCRYRGGKWKTMSVIEETGSGRRRGPSSVRLSSPVAVEDAVMSLPGDDSKTDADR
ncbi:MAG: MATE family efflux transporter [Planctomycetes bacterium]|nr:MATE family efflux transporter [Planctomycetota bacterium]